MLPSINTESFLRECARTLSRWPTVISILANLRRLRSTHSPTKPNAKLLAQLSDRKFDRTSPELRTNILEFYSDLSVAIETKKDNVRWQSVLKSLDQLKAATPGAIVADDLVSRPALEPTTKVTRTHQRLVVGGVPDPIGLPNSVSET